MVEGSRSTMPASASQAAPPAPTLLLRPGAPPMLSASPTPWPLSRACFFGGGASRLLPALRASHVPFSAFIGRPSWSIDEGA